MFRYMALERRSRERPAPPAAARRIRDIADVRALRALAHPTRVEIMELIAREGPLTATQTGDHLDMSAANASFHLRTLARYGFLEEAPGARGRERPWRLVSTGHTWREAPAAPAELTLASQELKRVVVDRAVGQLREYLDHRVAYPADWQRAGGTNDWQVFLTPDELITLHDGFAALLEPYLSRLTDPATRPDDALAVKVLAIAFPVQLPTSGDEDGPASDA